MSSPVIHSYVYTSTKYIPSTPVPLPGPPKRHVLNKSHRECR